MPGADGLHVRIAAKRFGNIAVLAGIEFAAAPGDILALLAPSGTGKTTALRIVLGLDPAFEGRLQIPAGRIGAVFQEPRLLPWLSVRQNVRLVQPDLSDAAIAGLLELAGLSEMDDAMPREISLGMARRAALARALAVRPALLVLDEPFASLDPLLSGRLSRSLADHARSIGAIVLMATHDLDQAMESADRLLVLQGTRPATLGEDIPTASVTPAAMRTRFAFLRTHPEVGIQARP